MQCNASMVYAVAVCPSVTHWYTVKQSTPYGSIGTLRNLSASHTSGNIARVRYDMFTHESEMHVACNFNCLVKTGGLLKVTGRLKCGNISKTVQNGDVFTDH